jgi:hypothetical protein
MRNLTSSTFQPYSQTSVVRRHLRKHLLSRTKGNVEAIMSGTFSLPWSTIYTDVATECIARETGVVVLPRAVHGIIPELMGCLYPCEKASWAHLNEEFEKVFAKVQKAYNGANQHSEFFSRARKMLDKGIDDYIGKLKKPDGILETWEDHGYCQRCRKTERKSKKTKGEGVFRLNE